MKNRNDRIRTCIGKNTNTSNKGGYFFMTRNICALPIKLRSEKGTIYVHTVFHTFQRLICTVPLMRVVGLEPTRSNEQRFLRPSPIPLRLYPPDSLTMFRTQNTCTPFRACYFSFSTSTQITIISL